MFERKKAQAAMEFLMTYGWAILVVLIAIGALAYFGVLNPDKLLPEKCIIATGSGLFCDDHSATTAGATPGITLRLQNILTEDVIIAASGITIDLGGAVTCTSPAVVVTIEPDTTDDIVVGTGCTLTSGQKVKGDITIAYTVTLTGLSKTTTGQVVTTAA